MPLYRERIGIFRGYGESQYELLSELLIPYYAHRTPLQGGYLIIGMKDFDGREGGILGRVVRAVPQGDLMAIAGEEYLMDLIRLDREVPEQILQSRLRYRVSLRLLGQIFPGASADQPGEPAIAIPLVFTPSVRMMPHLGAPVGFPSDEVMELIARGCPAPGADAGRRIGHLAVGDLTFDGSQRVRSKNYPVHFRMDSLVGRRTAVFARAGMGKSNFVKVLLSRLYENSGERTGALVIDPEGEYAMANASEPGLLDVPWLRDRVVLFTDRSDFDSRYAPFVAGPCRINFNDLGPADVVANAVSAEKQEAVFANLIRGLDKGAWTRLVTILAEKRYKADIQSIATLVGRAKRTNPRDGEDVSVSAIINNLVPPIQRLHDPQSTLLRETLQALREGKIVILDISLLASQDARTLSAWVINTLFSHNQRFFIRAGQPGGAPAAQTLIPALCVLEEAQFYLGGRELGEDSPFVRWFKEGRKYKLGSVLVTQQPGAVGTELISQCDNFFVFHLLSGLDLDALGRANMHYTRDILTSIASEPIPGNCYLWSSRGLSFVTCARIMAFAELAAREEKPATPAASPTARASSSSKRPGATSAPDEPVRLPVLKPKATGDDDQKFLTEITRKVLRSGSGLAFYEVPQLNTAGCETDPAAGPATEDLIAIKAYNLRFCVADALEYARGKKSMSESAFARLTEPFGDRTVVSEVYLQKALKELDCCPPRFIARASDDGESAKSAEYYLLFRRDPVPKRKPRQGPKSFDLLP